MFCNPPPTFIPVPRERLKPVRNSIVQDWARSWLKRMNQKKGKTNLLQLLLPTESFSLFLLLSHFLWRQCTNHSPKRCRSIADSRHSSRCRRGDRGNSSGSGRTGSTKKRQPSSTTSAGSSAIVPRPFLMVLKPASAIVPPHF